jgi:hypothetical protein
MLDSFWGHPKILELVESLPFISYKNIRNGLDLGLIYFILSFMKFDRNGWYFSYLAEIPVRGSFYEGLHFLEEFRKKEVDQLIWSSKWPGFSTRLALKLWVL